jgi:hypothetical protein
MTRRLRGKHRATFSAEALKGRNDRESRERYKKCFLRRTNMDKKTNFFNSVLDFFRKNILYFSPFFIIGLLGMFMVI